MRNGFKDLFSTDKPLKPLLGKPFAPPAHKFLAVVLVACSLLISCKDSTPKSGKLATDRVTSEQNKTEVSAQLKSSVGKEDGSTGVASRGEQHPSQSEPSSAQKAHQNSSKNRSEDAEVIPPEYPSEKGTTAAEVQMQITAAEAEKVDPSLVEVIPPQNPADSGVTAAEMEAYISVAGELSPETMEVIPPQNPGEPGITAAEMEVHMATGTKTDPKLLEVIPPENPGEPGITAAEVEARMAVSRTIDPKSLEVIPPTNPGEPGITAREVEALMAGGKEDTTK